MEPAKPREKVVVIIDDEDYSEQIARKPAKDGTPSTALLRRINPANERSLGTILSPSAPIAHSRHSTKYELPRTSSSTREASLGTFWGGSEKSHDQADSAQSHAIPVPPVVIDLEDAFEEEKFQRSRKRQLEAETLQPSPRPREKRARLPDDRSIPMRKLPVAAPQKILDTFTFEGVKVNPEATLELRDGDFIKIVKIFQDMETSKVTLLGWIFRPTKNMNNMLESKFNEVCWLLHLNTNDTRDVRVQGMESVSVSEVVKRRRIRLTNRSYPECTNEGVLVCRYRYTCYYTDSRARDRLEWCEKSLERVRPEDCQEAYGTPQEILRHHWRGDTTKGGSCASLVAGEAAFLRNARQHRSVGESVGIRKRRRSTSSKPDEAQSRNEIRGGQLELEEISKSEFAHAAKRQEIQFCSFFDRARSAYSKSTGLHDNSLFRYGSPEVVEVRAQIDTSSKLGTMRKEYQGHVTSTYLPTHPDTHQATPNPITVISEPSRSNSLYTITNSRFKNSDQKFGRPFPLAADSRPWPTPVSQDISRLSSIKGRRYTFGDCFCGAGGTSRGAVDAGLRVEWGFDSNDAACISYGLNYIGANVYPIDAHQFSGLADKEYKVDICHLSPPCQFFSNAHTVEGKDDDQNIASLFAVSELLNQAKPRIATLEQTNGLLLRHPLFFNKVINMFTTLGFSIRWRVINCADFGLPQRRNRVFLIASCPGEVLPNFPKPTHTGDPISQPGLKPWTTVNQAISSIPKDWMDHDIDTARRLDRKPFNGNSLATCMTTSGGGMIHPSGQRSLTNREFACLQGFPLQQRFSDTGVKRQIGNAVPPIVAKALFEEIKKALIKADRIL